MPYIGCGSCTQRKPSCGVAAVDPETVTPGVPTCFWVALVGFLLLKNDRA